MRETFLNFHELAQRIWNQEFEQEEFSEALQQIAEVKVILWSSNLMELEENIRLQFFEDLLKMELVTCQVLRPENVIQLNPEGRTFYGYLHTLLCNYSNDLLMIYHEFPFDSPVHISCGMCDNDVHSVLINPAHFDEKNVTTVIPTRYDSLKDGLYPEHTKGMNSAAVGFSESETVEGFGETDCDEWDFFSNVMRFLKSCEEEYLSGILTYFYGEHKCTRCQKTEVVMNSYCKWFYDKQENFNEPSEELISWLTEYAKKLTEDKNYYNDEFIAFLYRMAVWYEKSTKMPNMERVYSNMLSFYERNFGQERLYIRQMQTLTRTLLNMDFKVLQVRAYSKLAKCFSYEYSREGEEKNRWDLTEAALKKAIEIYKENQLEDDKLYWVLLNNMAVMAAEAGEGDVDEIEALILDYIKGQKSKKNSNMEDVGEAYNRLAYMFAEGAGEYEKTYEYFEKYLEICKQIYGEDSDYVADMYEELADYYEEDDKMEQALELREKALEINIREMGKMYLLPPVFKGIAIFAAKTAKIIDENDKFTRVMSTAGTYMELGESYYELDLTEKAMDCYKKAAELYEWEFKGRTAVGELGKAYYMMGNIYYDEDNERMSKKYYKEAKEVCQAVLEIGRYEEEVEMCEEILEDIQDKMTE